MRFAIHLQNISVLNPGTINIWDDSSLLHDLDIHLGHINLAVELGRKFRLLQKFGVHRGSHGCGERLETEARRVVTMGKLEEEDMVDLRSFNILEAV